MSLRSSTTNKRPSEVEYKLLSILRNRPMTGRTIAYQAEIRYFAMPFGTLYGSLRRMKQQDWVTVSPGKKDDRERIFTITKKGRTAIDRAFRHYVSLISMGEDHE